MSMITTAARRILRKDVRRPPSPVAARDQYPSMIFSLYDQAPGPSRRLIDLALEASRRIVRGQVKLDDIAARPNVPAWFDVWPGEHYLLLAALVQILQPRRVIEVGTFSGLSALAMKKYLPPDGRIDTFDLRPWRSIPDTALAEADFADGRLVQHLDNLADPLAFAHYRAMLTEAEFLFIDGPKDNVFEYRLVELLRTLRMERPPILLFDDTRLWSMLRFWRLLPMPKLDLTSLGSWSGTGLAELRC